MGLPLNLISTSQRITNFKPWIRCYNTPMQETSIAFWVWSITQRNTLQEWWSLKVAWQSLPRKMHHLCGVQSIVWNLKPSKIKFPVQPYWNRIPANLSHFKLMQSWKVLVIYFAGKSLQLHQKANVTIELESCAVAKVMEEIPQFLFWQKV